MQYIGSLQLLGSAAAFLTCGIAFAQTPASIVDRWPDSWGRSDPTGRHAASEPEMDRGYDRVWSIRPQSPVSPIVTMHELAHQIPRRAEREFKRALAAEDKVDREAAITYFQKAIAIDPQFCAALNDLGTTYLRKDQLDLAIEQFNKAIAVDPHAARPYSNLAIAYIRKDQYSDAERAARRVLDLDRAGTRGHFVLGISLVLQEKFTAEMQRSLQKAALDFPYANLWLAIGLAGKGEIETAKDQLRVYLARGEQVGTETVRSLLKQLSLNVNDKP